MLHKRGMWAIVAVVALCYALYLIVMHRKCRLSIPVPQVQRKWHWMLNVLFPVAFLWGVVSGDDIYFNYVEVLWIVGAVFMVHLAPNRIRPTGRWVLCARNCFEAKANALTVARNSKSGPSTRPCYWPDF